MYGSNFWIVTRRPRSTSSRPSEAAAMPFPSEETTPPVTKTYFVELTDSPPSADGSTAALRGAGPRRCRPRGRRRIEQRHADRDPVQQRPQLLQALRALLRHRRQLHPPLQCLARVSVHTDVLAIDHVAPAISVEWDRRA